MAQNKNILEAIIVTGFLKYLCIVSSHANLFVQMGHSACIVLPMLLPAKSLSWSCFQSSAYSFILQLLSVFHIVGAIFLSKARKRARTCIFSFLSLSSQGPPYPTAKTWVFSAMLTQRCLSWLVPFWALPVSSPLSEL